MTPTQCPGAELGVLLCAALASALGGCGSSEDLILGSNDFVLERRDDFDSIDLEYWELAGHTFEPNLAWFSPANAKAEGGQLVLSITQEQTPAVPTDISGRLRAVPTAAVWPMDRLYLSSGRINSRPHDRTSAPLVSFFISNTYIDFVWPHTKLPAMVKSKMGAPNLGHQLNK